MELGKMALNPILRKTLARTLQQVLRQQTAAMSGDSHEVMSPQYPTNQIGTREVVGYGFNGDKNYVDRMDFPMPAVRFMEDTKDIQALREKEKGDWTKLTLEEKKILYRAAFCQTFSEMEAPTGEWKSIWGWGLISCAIGVWWYIFMLLYVYAPIPTTFEKERVHAQMMRMIELRVDPITGIGSEWDYEKNDWKEK